MADRRGYSWPTATPGNTIAQKHGAASPRAVQPLAERLAAELTNDVEWTGRTPYAGTVAAWSWAEAQCILLRAWLDEVGLLDDDGVPRPAGAFLEKVETRAANLRAELGLSPLAHGRLLAVFASAAKAGVLDDDGALDALRAEGRSASRPGPPSWQAPPKTRTRTRTRKRDRNPPSVQQPIDNNRSDDVRYGYGQASDSMSPAGTRVVGYVRVSTHEQAESGAGLDAQRVAIEDAARRRGWVLVTILEDRGLSAKSTNGRPALAAAVALVEAGGADALVVSKLDRLSRSMLDFATLMERARKAGWAIVVLDMDFDMTTPTGELMANMLAAFAQFERRLIGQRTKDGLAIKKAQGVAMGRPRSTPKAVLNRVVRERASGASLGAIARGLNDDAIPTAQGGNRWYSSTVKALLTRAP